MKRLPIVLLVGIAGLMTALGIPRLTGTNKPPGYYLVTASANPGTVTVYVRAHNSYAPKKIINTGYQFVHTVRIGDIFNNGKLSVIAGVSNGFFREPYGCRIVAYDLTFFKPQTIDNVGDLRCKDLTIGDADNDGKNEIILGTHGEGLVTVYKWVRNSWTKTVLETNFIAQMDAKNQTNHRVPNADVSCKTCLIQTAVHIVKIGDIDNDGKNEIVATLSSPLELLTGQEISFIRVYRYANGTWSGETIDSLTGREFRSITIADIRNSGTNSLLIGIGSPRKDPGSLVAYEYQKHIWKKTVIHQDASELNMKGVDVGSIRNVPHAILLSTGFSNANIMSYRWEQTRFARADIGSVRGLFTMPDAQLNTMVAKIIPIEHGGFVIGGNAIFPKLNRTWETTDKGFLIQYADSGSPVILNTGNILGLDIR